MGAVIGELLPLGVGVAVSPIPIIAAILMLLGTHARTTSLGFALGWTLGITGVTALATFVGGTMTATGDTTSSVAWLKLVLGLVLLLLGARDWRGRHEAGATPSWMTAIDKMKPPAGFLIGVALSALNPKNLILCIAAGVTIGSAALSGGEQVGAAAVFIALAVASVMGPVLAYQVCAARLAGPLAALKGWLLANNAAVMAVLFLILGASLVGKGFGGLG